MDSSIGISSIDVVMGCDMGTNNFGFGVTKVTRKVDGSCSVKPLAGGLLENPLLNLSHVPKVERKKRNGKKSNAGKDEPGIEVGVELFINDVETLIISHRVNTVVMERFQSRGRGGGSTIEAIGVMIGMLITLCRKHNVRFVLLTAATWKNVCTKATRPDILDSLNAYAKQQWKQEPHAFDAVFMSMYVVAKSELPRLLTTKFMNAIRKVQVDE